MENILRLRNTSRFSLQTPTLDYIRRFAKGRNKKMVSKVIRASVLGASASVMAVAAVVLKRRKLSTSSRPREPKFDQDVAPERYMITCSSETYQEEIAAHPKHANFLNKKIEMSDEMHIVVGKDMATGCFAKSFNDIDLEASTGSNSAQDVEENDFEEMTKQKESSSIGPSLEPRCHKKRSREDGDSSIEILARQIGEIANAIKKLSSEKVNTRDLYKEVMNIKGFDEEFLGSVFDKLNANSSLAQGFMVKSHNLRRKWIEKFMT